MKALLALALAAGAALFLSNAAMAAPTDAQDEACADLTTLRLPDVTITQAAYVRPSPAWNAPPVHAGGPSAAQVTRPFCRVQGVVEDEIGFELWLPTPADWNGRFFGAGNGGFAGYIRYDGLAMGLARGFASVSTDTGHKETEKNWALGHPRRLENYGFRAHHLVAVNGKAIATHFYGAAPAHSYFLGCSGGGMQAMNEVQRYPADYDGVVAGASGQSIAGISARWLASALTANDPAVHLTAADWKAVADAAVAQCDGLDGVKDGIISDPQACRFDPAQTPGLSAAKGRTARALLGPITDDHGAVLFPGFAPGVRFHPLESPGQAGEMFAQWLYQDANWDFTRFNAARDLPAAEAALPGLTFSNPNLERFRRRGGKLIMTIGWADSIVPPQSDIDYWDEVRRFMGPEASDDVLRLFLAPGMDHCGGGPGPFSYTPSFEAQSPVVDPEHDLLAASVAWVEQGHAPDRVIASRVENDRVTMTRPLCAWPEAARYDGKGDPAVAASFSCVSPGGPR